jgi:hypothetical protein
VYILGSNGNIRVVVGLDIEYLGKTATLSIWHPKFLIDNDGKEELQAEQTVTNQVCLSTPFTSYLLTILDYPLRQWQAKYRPTSRSISPT